MGAFVVEYDGQIIEAFLTRKAPLLLAYLAMLPGKHSRDTLAALFWSETTDEQALKNLRTVLSNLRKVVPDAVLISRQSVQIRDSVWIDAREFNQGCDAFFAGAEMSLDEMLALAHLYHGDFLLNVPIRQAEGLQAWVDQQHNLLQQKQEQLLHRITEHCLQIGDAYTGVTIARQLVMMNPLWEDAQRQLMRLLVQLNQSGEAQMQYERVVALLDDELGVEPETETIRLYEQIKSGALQPLQKAAVPPIVLPDVPYVPPQKDIAYLRERLDAPDGRLVTLTGIGGTGKSLLATFTAHERQPYYRDGAVIVSLAPIQTTAKLSQAILSSLNVPVNATPDDQLIAELKQRHMLLVMDNYEHLLPDTTLIARILEEAPDVQVLVTSQVALNLRQEWVLPLQGLRVNVPDATETSEFEAINLFRHTAERVRPHFDARGRRT